MFLTCKLTLISTLHDWRFSTGQITRLFSSAKFRWAFVKGKKNPVLAVDIRFFLCFCSVSQKWAALPTNMGSRERQVSCWAESVICLERRKKMRKIVLNVEHAICRDMRRSRPALDWHTTVNAPIKQGKPRRSSASRPRGSFCVVLSHRVQLWVPGRQCSGGEGRCWQQILQAQSGLWQGSGSAVGWELEVCVTMTMMTTARTTQTWFHKSVCMFKERAPVSEQTAQVAKNTVTEDIIPCVFPNASASPGRLMPVTLSQKCAVFCFVI